MAGVGNEEIAGGIECEAFRSGERRGEAGERKDCGRAAIECGADDAVGLRVGDVEVATAVDRHSGRLRERGSGEGERGGRDAGDDGVDLALLRHRNVERSVTGDRHRRHDGAGQREHRAEDSGRALLQDAVVEDVVEVEVAGTVVDQRGGRIEDRRKRRDRAGDCGRIRREDKLRADADAVDGDDDRRAAGSVERECTVARADGDGLEVNFDGASGWAGDSAAAGLRGDGEILQRGAEGLRADAADAGGLSVGNIEGDVCGSGGGPDVDRAEIDGAAAIGDGLRAQRGTREKQDCEKREANGPDKELSKTRGRPSRLTD